MGCGSFPTNEAASRWPVRCLGHETIWTGERKHMVCGLCRVTFKARLCRTLHVHQLNGQPLVSCSYIESLKRKQEVAHTYRRIRRSTHYIHGYATCCGLHPDGQPTWQSVCRDITRLALSKQICLQLVIVYCDVDRLALCKILFFDVISSAVSQCFVLTICCAQDIT